MSKSDIEQAAYQLLTRFPGMTIAEIAAHIPDADTAQVEAAIQESAAFWEDEDGLYPLNSTSSAEFQGDFIQYAIVELDGDLYTLAEVRAIMDDGESLAVVIGGGHWRVLKSDGCLQFVEVTE